MGCLKWSECMSVGVPLLDADNQAVIALINRLEESARRRDEPKVLAEYFDLLIASIEYHLAREEKVMEVCAFPGLDQQRADHGRLVDEMYNLKKRYSVSGDADDLLEGAMRLAHWFEDHVLTSDTPLADFARRTPRANDVAEAFGRLPGA